MKDIITSIISTNKGWLVRQALKYVAVGGAAITSWLIAKGYDSANAEALISGVTAGIAGGLELLLSKLASKVATKE